MEILKCSKTSLGSLIHWSSSRFNERKKPEVVADIIYRVERGHDCMVEYRSGVYSEGAHTGRCPSKWTGGKYTLLVENGRAFLSNAVSDIKRDSVETVELLKPEKPIYFIPARMVIYKGEEYQVLDQTLFDFIVNKKTEVNFKNPSYGTYMTNYLPKKLCEITASMGKDETYPFFAKIDFLGLGKNGSGAIVGETILYKNESEYMKEIRESQSCGQPIDYQRISEEEYYRIACSNIPVWMHDQEDYEMEL